MKKRYSKAVKSIKKQKLSGLRNGRSVERAYYTNFFFFVHMLALVHDDYSQKKSVFFG